jgi:hypothetical protein
MTRHAYLDANDVVVQIIAGAVNGAAHDGLLKNYGALYGAVRCVQVPTKETPIWIGGSYTGGEFTPPPAPPVEPEPEPEPEI